MSRAAKSTRLQRGFTIIELMIATSIFSVILVLVTTMMTSIGRLYSKGINQARVQDTVRTVSDEFSEHLQLSNGGAISVTSVDGKLKAYCIGTARYSYVLNKQMGDASTQTPHVLWRDNNPTPNGCSVANNFLSSATPSAGGVELVPNNSRLTALCVGGYNATTNVCTAATSSPYQITAGVAYGDDDLLANSGTNTTCSGTAGTQFCATASLTTTVAKRLTGESN